MFEDSDNYFLSRRSPDAKNDKALFIGFLLDRNCFRVNSIRVTFTNRRRGTTPDDHAEPLKYIAPGKMKLLLCKNKTEPSEKREKIVFDKFVELDVPFDCQNNLICLLLLHDLLD